MTIETDPSLDEVDRQILAELQADGRMTNVELARRVGLSAPPCLRRVRRLEEERIIRGYHADLDPVALGYEITFFALVGLESQKEAMLTAFESRVRGWPEVSAAVGVMNWSMERAAEGPRDPSAPKDLIATVGVDGDPTAIPNMAVIAESQGRLGFPFYFPGLRKTGSSYPDDKPRVYGIRDERGKIHRAYRLVVSKGVIGEYYGIQGTTWREPPILDDPSETRKVNGRKLELHYDGRRLRLVAWRTRRAVYWVSNTLTQSLSTRQMIAITASLRRLGQK